MMNPYIKNLKKIEFIVTMACTGKCKHCSEGDHIGFTEHIESMVQEKKSIFSGQEKMRISIWRV